MKRCSICGENKPLSDFPRRSDRASGVRAACKRCTTAAAKTYYDSHAEERRAAARADYHRRKESDPTFPQRNRDKVAEYGRLFPDKVRAQAKAHRRRHRDRRNADARRWRAENPETMRRINRRTKAQRKAAFIEDVDELVLLEMDDGVCGICGEDVDPFDYELDHEIPVARGGMHCYANMQVAHPECNRSKGKLLPEWLTC